VNGQVLRILRKLKDEPSIMRAAFWKASGVAKRERPMFSVQKSSTG
jgi:hypothetical protein